MVKEEISAAQLMCKAADCLEKQAIDDLGTLGKSVDPPVSTSKAPLALAQKTRQEFPASSPAWAGVKGFVGGLPQGVNNTVNAFVGGLEAAAGGIGTLGAAAHAVSNPAPAEAGVAWDIANQMGRFTGAGAKNFRDALFNIKGPNHVTKMQQEVMDRGRMSPTTQDTMRGTLAGGRLAGEGATYLAGPGVLNAGIRGSVGGFRGATGFGRFTEAVSGMGSRGATQLNNATKFTSIPQALKTLWRPQRGLTAGTTLVLAGGPGAYGAGKSVVDAYRSPWLPRDVSQKLGPNKAQDLEIQLRDSAQNVAADYFTPGFLRSKEMNPVDKAVGGAGLEYGINRAREAVADYFEKSKPTLPTGVHLGVAGLKRLAGQYVPPEASDLMGALRKIKDSPDLTEALRKIKESPDLMGALRKIKDSPDLTGALRKVPGIAGQTAEDIRSSNLLRQVLLSVRGYPGLLRDNLRNYSNSRERRSN